jgi:IS30 family transposase
VRLPRATRYPVTAEDNARRRRRRQRKLVRDPRLRGHIVEKRKLCWSPEQIAGRLKLTGEDDCLCHETIYQFVYSPEGRALELHRHLLRARRLRRRRFGPARLQEIERQMNDTPRKCLGFRTPQEAFTATAG